ncbi:MAG: DUF1566 domain-containing protein, partial [Gammaproteobacteria bacterium]|nr:DUF1566 domain-containing protein [Gammaproteobacteria bacterium]
IIDNAISYKNYTDKQNNKVHNIICRSSKLDKKVNALTTQIEEANNELKTTLSIPELTIDEHNNTWSCIVQALSNLINQRCKLPENISQKIRIFSKKLAKMMGLNKSTQEFKMTTKRINIMLLSIILILSGQLQAQTCNSYTTLVSPDSRFTTDSNGTVTDNQTGLMWMSCSLGQDWDSDSSTCMETAIKYNWKEALGAAESTGFARYSDWRLPNVSELTSITEIACHSPAINESVFPTTGSSYYWSSSPYIELNSDAWVVSFSFGFSNIAFKYDNYQVRLVRAGY